MVAEIESLCRAVKTGTDLLGNLVLSGDSDWVQLRVGTQCPILPQAERLSKSVPTCRRTLWAKSKVIRLKANLISISTPKLHSKQRWRDLLPRTNGNCDAGICFKIIFAHNTVLQTTAKQSSGGPQRFKNTSTLTEKHFTRRNWQTPPLSISKHGQSSPHARESEANTLRGMFLTHAIFLHLKQDGPHSGHCRPHVPKLHLLHKSHETP